MAWAIQCLKDSEMTVKIEQACQDICQYLQITWPEPTKILHWVHPPQATGLRMTVWMNPEWSVSLSAPVSVKRSMKILKGTPREAVFKILRKRQSETYQTHQDLLLYSNPTLYWKDWSDSLHQRRIPGIANALHAASVGREQGSLSTFFFTVNSFRMQELSWRILNEYI